MTNLRSVSRSILILSFVINWVPNPIRKSIDRQWHKVNKIRRKQRWVPTYMEVPLFEGSGRIVRVKTGHKKFI